MMQVVARCGMALPCEAEVKLELHSGVVARQVNT